MRVLESYYQWVLDLFGPFVGRRIVDAGCGVGNFTQLLAGRADRVVAADLSAQNLAVLRERFAGQPQVVVERADLDGDLSGLAAHDPDTIVCLDVLEHIDDDVGLLARLRGIVRPGGHLLVKVPACPWLLGSIDAASGHRRRYTPRELADKARIAGWTPLRCHYMNLAAVAPYWLKCRLMGRRSNFSRTFKPWQLALIRAAVPFLRLVDRVSGPPVGLSAVLVARGGATSAPATSSLRGRAGSASPAG
jgi:2-polyprenyl-3-methyl-5-hydroxy-6-metoxy-1,4-benzoquinol methylase